MCTKQINNELRFWTIVKFLSRKSGEKLYLETTIFLQILDDLISMLILMLDSSNSYKEIKI